MTEIANRTDPPVRRVRWKRYVFGALVLLFLVLIALAPSGGSHITPAMRDSSRAARQAHAIGLLMMAYADAHDGAFPTGKSSTEIFQKLVDENHMMPSGKSYAEILEGLTQNQPVNDPIFFWLDVPGKTRATSAVLKPENVCWDVTVSVNRNSPGELPLVFVTGYRVTYAPGGTALPLPQTGVRPWTAVLYANGSAYGTSIEFGIPPGLMIQSDSSVLNFIPATFNPAGKHYQQLTPDGPLAP